MLFFPAYFQGATGIIVGAVVGSVATVAVAVVIFVFFVWKSRRRRSKKSNGKNCVSDNTGSYV